MSIPPSMRSETRYDHIIIGSGINALTAAAMLGKAGRKVLVLERNATFGGCIQSGEIIAPGFVHDIMATTFVLFLLSPAYAALRDDLARHGVVFVRSDYPSGVLTADGQSLRMTMQRAANIAAFEAASPGDGDAYRAMVAEIEANSTLLFALLGSPLWSRSMAWLILRQSWKRGARALAGFLGTALTPARAYLESDFTAPLSRAMWAPWPLHTGLNPESSYSAIMAKIIAFSLEAAGAPIVKGGAYNLVKAFQSLIESQNGTLCSGVDVTQIKIDNNRAVGVICADGTPITARSGVLASVTPTQLYGRLLADPPQDEAAAAAKWRYGKGNFQLHYALERPPQWKAPGLERVSLLHLTPGLDAVSRAANAAECGLLPETPTLCVGQPSATDPSRAPAGKAILWIQLAETPSLIKGDAANQIAAPDDGRWNDTIREAYADRIEAILARHIDNFAATIIGRKAYSPSDLEAMNINLHGGDPYGGFCGLDQFFLWRPSKYGDSHRISINNLWMIGASTHPGPGLGGGSGWIVARRLTKRSLFG